MLRNKMWWSECGYSFKADPCVIRAGILQINIKRMNGGSSVNNMYLDVVLIIVRKSLLCSRGIMTKKWQHGLFCTTWFLNNELCSILSQTSSVENLWTGGMHLTFSKGLKVKRIK